MIGLICLSLALQQPLGQRQDSAISIEARAGFSGVVLVAHGDTIVFEKAYGQASTLGVPVEKLAFWLASNSKQFTAAGILRLAEMGRLSVNDSIGRFFSNVPRDKRGITIHQLLTHTSGLPHEYRADGIVERDRAVAEILKLGLSAKPGAKYSYSNDGYTLLAAIIERAAGVAFDDFMRDSLFTRAALQNTGLWGHEIARVRIAPVPDPRRLVRQRPTIFAAGHSVGNWGYRGPTGVFASARDVYLWIRALQKGRVLSPASMRMLVGRHVVVRADSTGQSYTGYGWGVRVEAGRDVSYGHVGNEDWLGHNGVIRFTPSRDVVVVLSNSGDINGTGWASRVNSVVRRVVDPKR
jgi:CubicO group peptidase (beta-lactamase class C family)